ncbi:MAG TPA: glycoside hydrolase domain-containing protein [Longimicrobium sp.]|nr:glycoside hydrolase domain-containing protein [Longimicrobium sp.]
MNPAASTLAGTVQAAAHDAKGFDANATITPSIAQAFVQAGYQFCIRYVGLVSMHSYDLTAGEAATILQSGLALMVVQHVEYEGWAPSGDLGTEYGAKAAMLTQQIGIPAGVNVWLDLEGVAEGTPAQNVTDYCNNWFAQVQAAGYVPGLYVGYGAGLGPQGLYDLPFQHYWSAYNLNADQYPAVRGVQMRQKTGTGTIGGLTTEDYDDDFTQTDALGGNAIWLAPAAT